MTDQTPEPAADPRVEHTIEQLAQYSAARDRHEHHSSSWEQLPITGQEEYRKDAQHAVMALLALGWTPPPWPEYGTQNRSTPAGRALADAFTLTHDTLAEAVAFAEHDPNEKLVVRRPAVPAGEWQPLP